MMSFTETDLQDPEHWAVQAGLRMRCAICGAESGLRCRDIVTGETLTGRVIHRYRVDPTKAGGGR